MGSDLKWSIWRGIPLFYIVNIFCFLLTLPFITSLSCQLYLFFSCSRVYYISYSLSSMIYSVQCLSSFTYFASLIIYKLISIIKHSTFSKYLLPSKIVRSLSGLCNFLLLIRNLSPKIIVCILPPIICNFLYSFL